MGGAGEDSGGGPQQASRGPGPRVLLHTCCAPCLIHPAAVLAARGLEVVPFFYNPNVHPFREYRERYFAVVDYCASRGLDLRAGPYEMERFLAEVSPVAAPGAPAPPRCAKCFSLRLRRAAAEASRLGIEAYTTTLLVSPYQDQSLIREAGEDAAIEHGIRFLFEDMTAGYPDAVAASRAQGMYRQSYCGCVYSEKERYQKADPPTR